MYWLYDFTSLVQSYYRQMFLPLTCCKLTANHQMTKLGSTVADEHNWTLVCKEVQMFLHVCCVLATFCLIISELQKIKIKIQF